MTTTIIAIGLVLVASVSGSAGAAAQSKTADPFAFYQEYLGVLAKATSLEPLLPYFTKEMAGMMRKAPKDQQANYLKANKRVLTDVKVTKQTGTGDKADLQMTAKDTAGQAFTGSAQLVKEGGAWKIADFAWIGPPPKS